MWKRPTDLTVNLKASSYHQIEKNYFVATDYITKPRNGTLIVINQDSKDDFMEMCCHYWKGKNPQIYSPIIDFLFSVLLVYSYNHEDNNSE